MTVEEPQNLRCFAADSTSAVILPVKKNILFVMNKNLIKYVSDFLNIEY